MLVDFRVRPPLASFLRQPIFTSYSDPGSGITSRDAVLYRDRGEAQSAHTGSLDGFLKESDAAGVTHSVIFGRSAGKRFGDTDDAEILRLCEEYPGRFSAFTGVDPRDPPKALDKIRRAGPAGFIGVAFDSGFVGMHHDDEAMTPLYEAALEAGLLLGLTSSQMIGPDLSYSHPDHIRAVAVQFPELNIVVTHGCWPWTTLACAAAFQCANIHLAPDFYLNLKAPGYSEYVNAANTFMAGQLLFASSYPSRPIGESVRNFTALGLDARALEQALWSNAQKLLGLPVP